MARQRRIILCGDLVWAHDEVEQLFHGVAVVVNMDSPNRADFLMGLKPGGKYDGAVGIYRHNASADRIGVFDKEIITALAATGTVKWIAHNGAGYDQIDIEECAKRGSHPSFTLPFFLSLHLYTTTHAYYPRMYKIGISVSNTPGAVDDATATTALYLLISCLRHFSLAERSLRTGTWKTPISSGRTHDLTSRTLGILGLGGIGLRLANLVHAFPMRVVYYSRHRVRNAPEWCEYVGSMEALLKQSDVLSVHVPLRADTIHLVGEKEIRTMKRGSVIINTARGKIIDEEALIRALEDGHISSVGLDVYPDEPNVNPRLLAFPQNALLPHMGTETQDSQREMEIRALLNLRDFLLEGRGKDLVPEMRR
ncbi:D-isomer specific 2-hydroxyacid dehydrogenase [Pisolithus orientalis]|uniref:D-isomer specific 2-hydroxyacid dehydrogenase n=1 Tax=Pisolithus orientalis TaxID=936130 RepID=UPI00222544AE|nr:D-isomer specific 2-hydroxyacid dehydrogenase [Pisolithus orientalis]KAI6007724.1 D-isomer specific 2-hydroxyacid dehydrogenase [Pisolithus orientalis]